MRIKDFEPCESVVWETTCTRNSCLICSNNSKSAKNRWLDIWRRNDFCSRASFSCPIRHCWKFLDKHQIVIQSKRICYPCSIMSTASSSTKRFTTKYLPWCRKRAKRSICSPPCSVRKVLEIIGSHYLNRPITIQIRLSYNALKYCDWSI